MRTRVLVIVAAAVAFLATLGTPTVEAAETRLSVVISNEQPGLLVDRLIAAGFGDKTLMEVLQLLQPLSGGSIPASFVTQVGSRPGTEPFSARLSSYQGLQGGIEIADDSTMNIPSTRGQDHDGQSGHLTHIEPMTGVGPVVFTSASSASNYVWTHTAHFGVLVRDYYAFAIVWKGADTPARLFPGIASMAGSSNTRWRSEGVLANPTATAAEATLELIPRDAAAVTATVSHTVQPGATLRLADLYADMSVASGAGMLRLTSTLPAWVRTFNQGTPGTFGQDVPPVTLDDAFPTATDVLFPVTTPADPARDFRSNLLVLNLEAAPVTFTLSAAGTTTSFSVPGGTYHQVDKVGTVMGLPAGVAALAVRATGRWSGTVSAVDPGSGDPTTMRGLLPTPRDVVLFPGVASAPGANQTQWRSEGLVYNRATTARAVLLELLPKDGTTVAASTSLSLAGGEIRRLADLYAALHASQGSGMLRVTGDVLTWVRTYNQGTSSTFGQDVPPVLPAGGTAAGVEVLFPISRPADKNKDFRSNLLLVNHETFKLTCTVSAGATSKTTEVPAGAYAQINDVGAWLGVPAGWATITVRANGRWSGTVSTIDPYTGDPTTVSGILR